MFLNGWFHRLGSIFKLNFYHWEKIISVALIFRYEFFLTLTYTNLQLKTLGGSRFAWRDNSCRCTSPSTSHSSIESKRNRSKINNLKTFERNIFFHSDGSTKKNIILIHFCSLKRDTKSPMQCQCNWTQLTEFMWLV